MWLLFLLLVLNIIRKIVVPIVINPPMTVPTIGPIGTSELGPEPNGESLKEGPWVCEGVLDGVCEGLLFGLVDPFITRM